MQAQPQWAQGQASQGPSGPNAPHPPQPPQPPQPPMPGAPPPPAVSPQGDLERRLNAVETRQALRGYSLLYAPMLLLVPLFLFVPFYETFDPGDSGFSIDYLMLWEIAAQGHLIGLISILFMGVLAMLLGIGVFRPGTPAVPSGIAVICGILFLLLALKIEAGPQATYSVAGYAAMILGVAGVITGIANEIHGVVRRMTRPRSV